MLSLGVKDHDCNFLFILFLWQVKMLMSIMNTIECKLDKLLQQKEKEKLLNNVRIVKANGPNAYGLQLLDISLQKMSLQETF